MSGHSRWSQVKHKKAITDAKKGQLFSKLVREITVAACSGGPNPESNPGLRAALARARSIGLPKDSIERAVARALGTEGDALLQEFLYEATAPGGLMILTEGITDNKNRSLSGVKQILAKHGAKLVPQNSLLWNFEKTWNDEGKDYPPKTRAEVSPGEKEKLVLLLDELSDHDDVQEAYTNLSD